MTDPSRRRFLRSGLGMAASGFALGAIPQEPGERPIEAGSVRVLNPRDRVPLSFIIDDSTCLVNLAHFAIPQFREVLPDDYPQPWRELPREIPDTFVRKFGTWCREHGVKGKYSVVPYPACVGWIDREMPGWSKRELRESLDLVRTFMTPDWDIHPEMVSHTWVINTKTGRPYPERSLKFMENWEWSAGRSTDELADYLAYALRLLKNVDLPCEGVTTPGGFGTKALPELSQATLESVRDVYGAEIPHYFRHLYTGDESVAPRVEYASGLDGPNPRCVVSIIGCTGDWFGGWDGLTPGTVDQFITEDLQGGRLPEVIARGEPAVLVCHWPGIYYNGDEIGFDIFKEIVARLDAGFDNLHWMKLSAIARYWAARTLTSITAAPGLASFHAPYACPDFTFAIDSSPSGPPSHAAEGAEAPPLREVSGPRRLETGTWCRADRGFLACVDLPKGASSITWPS